MIGNPLVGTWKLVSCEVRRADGSIGYPWGPDAEGYIMYTQDGYMSAVITAPNRACFATDDVKGGSLQERAAAADTYLSYCGTYEYLGERVIHHVKASLFPNWTGGDQERLVKLEANRLTLSTPPMPVQGMPGTGYLIWERP